MLQGGLALEEEVDGLGKEKDKQAGEGRGSSERRRRRRRRRCEVGNRRDASRGKGRGEAEQYEGPLCSDETDEQSRCDVVFGNCNEGREIRTPNLLIWSQTRCRCAIPPMEE